MNGYHNILTAMSTVWAIMPDKLRLHSLQLMEMAKLTQPQIATLAADLEKQAAASTKRIREVNGSVAVLPLYGVINQKPSIFMDLFGGTSTEVFGRAFDQAMDLKDVKAIVIDMDSPGGSVPGVPELSAKIFNARGQGKQIIAVANSLSASAAYWIGSAADQLIVTPSGEAGSIGVYAMHIDETKLNERIGITPTYISAGKYKVEGNPDEPLSADARNTFQSQVDGIYRTFIADVARNRGTTAHKVRNGYGEGRTLSSADAVEEGLADRVATMDRVLQELGVIPSASRGRRAEGEGLDVKAADELKRLRWANTKRKLGL